MGLPLAWFLRGPGTGAKDGTQQHGAHSDNLARLFPGLTPPLLSSGHLYESSDPRSYRDVLEASMISWAGLPGAMRNEQYLAKILGLRIRDATLKAEDPRGALVVLSQSRIPDPSTGGTGRADLLLVCEKHPKDGAQFHPPEARLMVEFGLNHNEWWKELDQVVMYVNGMDNLVDAVLFAVVTVQAKQGDGAATRGVFESARIGLFLATPTSRKAQPGKVTDASESRISLLWHMETESLRSLSDAFGRALFASTRLLPEWREASQRMKERGEYRYLGPNCCRIKDEVLRAYDNRACFTERSPDVYLHSGETGPTEIICDFREGKGTSRDFGVRDEGDLVGDRLWCVGRGDRTSRLLVISTPFVEGRPWALTPTEFRPLVAQLESLHAKGYVHGDIRCFNVAFGPNQVSRLFDFDLGGRVVDTAGSGTDAEDGCDSPQLPTDPTSDPELDPTASGGMIPLRPGWSRATLCYPAGYRQDLADGIRLGVEGFPVTKSDDWHALTSVILRCHELVGPSTAAAELDGGADSRGDDLRGDDDDGAVAVAVSRMERVLRRFPQGDSDVARHLGRLKAYVGALEDLCQRATWRIVPTARFAQQLVKEGFAVDMDGTVPRSRSKSGTLEGRGGAKSGHRQPRRR